MRCLHEIICQYEPPQAIRQQAWFFIFSEDDPMPTLKVEMLEGRTPEQKTALVKALTQAVVDSLGSKPESVDILLFDIPRQNWATGGIQWSERQ
jgi:4-oxalocrotonate tautomerase